jgi:hypothetical protein
MKIIFSVEKVILAGLKIRPLDLLPGNTAAGISVNLGHPQGRASKFRSISLAEFHAFL